MRGTRVQSGHTLAELIVVIGVSSVMFTAMMTTMSSTIQAMDHLERRSEADHGAAYALRRLSMELAPALSLTTAESTHIVFVTPDITGDAADDTVQYVWSGTELLRTLNSGDAQVIASDVQSCEFEYVYGDQTKAGVFPEGEVDEVTIAQFDGFPEEAGSTVGPPPTFTLWFADIMHQQFVARSDADVPAALEINVEANRGTIPLLVKLLDTNDWTTLAVGTLSGVPPDGEVRRHSIPLAWVCADQRGLRKGNWYAVELRSEDLNGYACEVQYSRISAWAPGVSDWPNLMVPYFSNNFGGSWYNHGDASDMIFKLTGFKRRHHGRYGQETQNRPEAVDVTLQAGQGAQSTRHRMRIRLLNH